MTFNERLAELGVDLSDLPEHERIPILGINGTIFEWKGEPLCRVDLYRYILHLVDIIDRMETRIVNLTGERDYLLTLYGYDCEECKRYNECNKDTDYCEGDIVDDWVGVPEDWRAYDGSTV